MRSFALRGTPTDHVVSREMALELTEDRGNGERVERHVAFGVEPIGRLHEPEQRGLHEIEFRFTAVAEASGALCGDPPVVDDQLLAKRWIASRSEAPELGTHIIVRRLASFVRRSRCRKVLHLRVVPDDPHRET